MERPVWGGRFKPSGDAEVLRHVEEAPARSEDLAAARPNIFTSRLGCSRAEKRGLVCSASMEDVDCQCILVKTHTTLSV